MKVFLSFGGGVNSVALHIMLCEQGIEFESVFADHGSDHPKTYEYVKCFNEECEKRGWIQVTIIEGVYKDKSMDKALNLYDYCIEKQIMPSMMFRWCTEKFKIKPVHDYINSKLEDGEECELLIGIASDESHRANAPKQPPKWMRNKIFKYPFVEQEIDRKGNKCIIQTNGFKIPPKSGCYYCPFQKVSELKRLYKNDPELYEKATSLEWNVNTKRVKDFKDPLYIKVKAPLRDIVQEGQFEIDLSEFEILEENKPCQCGL